MTKKRKKKLLFLNKILNFKIKKKFFPTDFSKYCKEHFLKVSGRYPKKYRRQIFRQIVFFAVLV